MLCKKCGKEFIPEKGLISYCSLGCRNSRERTDSTKEKIRAGHYRWLEDIRNDPTRFLEYKARISESRYKTQAASSAKRIATCKSKLLSSDFSKLTVWKKRDRCIEEQGGKCGHCGLSEWRGKKLILELDHIDGNHNNHSRDNYVAICPNCHSITPTWRGRNKQSVRRVSDEVALDALKTSSSIRQALIKVGLSPRGGNYRRFTNLKNGVVADR